MQTIENPTLIINFLSIYGDNDLSENIDREVQQLSRYGHLSYTELMTLMSWKDRQFWINATKKDMSSEIPNNSFNETNIDSITNSL